MLRSPCLLVFRNFGILFSSIPNWLKPLILYLASGRCPMSDLFKSETLKLHSEMVRQPFSVHTSWLEPGSYTTHAQTAQPARLRLPSSRLSIWAHPASSPLNPLPREMCDPCPHAMWINSFTTLARDCTVCFGACWGEGAVTSFPLNTEVTTHLPHTFREGTGARKSFLQRLSPWPTLDSR
jgi:hypothetical protein